MGTESTRNGVTLELPEPGIILMREALTQNKDVADWRLKSDQWLFTFRVPKSYDVVTFDYYTGVGLRKRKKTTRCYYGVMDVSTASEATPVKPSVQDLLYSLTLDSEACEYSFDEWCDNYDYATDSRKALETYLQCQENTKKLQRLRIASLETLREYFTDY